MDKLICVVGVLGFFMMGLIVGVVLMEDDDDE